MLHVLLISILFLTGCPKEPTDTPPTETGSPDTWPQPHDLDGDGWTPAEGDCDDNDALVHPDRAETCNGVDDDCDGSVDNGLPDADGDGLADCHDEEVCDGVDNDGDDLVDEGSLDADLDGTPDCSDLEECDALDNDGDGQVDEGFDEDGDGWTLCGSTRKAPDCDDGDPSSWPGAAEAQDGRDNDCDTLVDEGSWTSGDLVLTEVMVNPSAVADPQGEWFEVVNATDRTLYLAGLTLRSSDGAEVATLEGNDTAMAPGERRVLALEEDPDLNGRVPVDLVYGGVRFDNESDSLEIYAGEVLLDRLAWDDGATLPDAAGASLTVDPWFANGVDNDAPTAWCAAPAPWLPGSDLGSPGAGNAPCPSFDHDADGWTGDAGDCDDANPLTFPGAVEWWYDGYDSDCDGWDDFDADKDDHVALEWGGDDCDDTRDTTNPDAPESCDDADTDEDCDGLADDADSDVEGTSTWYPDTDGDGYGSEATSQDLCDPGPGWTTDATDCDDTTSTVSPDSLEVCGDGLDNDCSGGDPTCGLSGEISASAAVATLNGSYTSGYLGHSLDILPDENGDGYADLVVGADQASSSRGYVYVVRGPVTGTLSVDAAASTSWRGYTYSDYLGNDVAYAGDVNGDGYSDLLMGAYGRDLPDTSSGVAYLATGPLTAGLMASLRDDAMIFISGADSGDYLGAGVATAGDIDGDGQDEYLVGAPNDDAGGSNAGVVYVFNEPTDTAVDVGDGVLVVGANAGDQLGYAMAGLGDSDGDGVGDLLLGARQADPAGTSSGRVWLLRGPVTANSNLDDCPTSFTGDSSDDQVGYSVAAAGDVNGDGYRDAIMGSLRADDGTTDGGAAFLFLGPAPLASTPVGSADAILYSSSRNAQAGYAVTGNGDVNGDGFHDLVVGAINDPVSYSSGGAAYVFLGPITGGVDTGAADATLPSASTSDAMGSSLSIGGDVNGDGFDDLWVGARVAGSSNRGAAYLFTGGMGE